MTENKRQKTLESLAGMSMYKSCEFGQLVREIQHNAGKELGDLTYADVDQWIEWLATDIQESCKGW